MQTATQARGLPISGVSGLSCSQHLGGKPIGHIDVPVHRCRQDVRNKPAPGLYIGNRDRSPCLTNLSLEHFMLHDVAGEDRQGTCTHHLLFALEMILHLRVDLVEQHHQLIVCRLIDTLEQRFQDRMVPVHQWHS